MKKTGIIGGTFNPIHNGHLFIAEEARQVFDLSEVIFVPNKVPPHRDNIILPDHEHRWNMINISISSNPFFSSSRVELDREGPSYSVDTVTYFAETLSHDGLFFITGLDALLNYTWYNFDGLMPKLEGFIAFSRPGYSRELFREKVDRLYPSWINKIHNLDTLLLEISSSDIRKRLQEGKSIKYLLPEGVEQYIGEHSLYR